jgi:hypothetical protein
MDSRKLFFELREAQMKIVEATCFDGSECDSTTLEYGPKVTELQIQKLRTNLHPLDF